MESSNNYFQMMLELRQNIDWINHILKGNELDSVIIDGIEKPSISKDIADRWSAISAMVQGRSAYKTKSELPSPPPVGVVLAEVWNDPTLINNGLYGWNGSGWERSPYDMSVLADEKIVENNDFYQLNQIQVDSDGYIPIIMDEKGTIALSVHKETGKVKADIDAMRLSLSSVSQISDQAAKEWLYAVADSVGNILLGIHQTGAVSLLSAICESIDQELDSDFLFAITDENKNVAFGITKQGKFVAQLEDEITEIPPWYIDHPATEINHVLVAGQSLSLGSLGLPSLTLDSVDDHLMLNDGVRSMYDSTVPTDFALLHESDYQGSLGSLGETVASGCAGQVTSLVQGELPNNAIFTHKLCCSCNGKGGASLYEMRRGTDKYNLGLEQIRKAKSFAESRGETYSVSAVFWIQGEWETKRDASPDQYLIDLIELKNNYNTDIQLITGQSERIPMIIYQVSSHTISNKPHATIALAHLKAAETDSEIHLATPTYIFPYAPDGLHMQNHGYRHMGHYFGKAYKRVVIERQAWEPIRPKTVNQVGDNIIVAEFVVPTPPLQFDELLVGNPGNYGFEVEDDTGLVDIASVEIISPTRIKVVTAKSLTGNAFLQYAYRGGYTPIGPFTGARGNLCDSDKTVARFTNENGKPYPLKNWCVIFNKQAAK